MSFENSKSTVMIHHLLAPQISYYRIQFVISGYTFVSRPDSY